MDAELAGFHGWFADRYRANTYTVSRVPLDSLPEWRTESGSGDIRHRTRRFFSIRGLEVHTDHRPVGSWSQPIIVQPEIGLLGILVKVIDGVPHCLLQAKMEPGNVGFVQLAPTVQATLSNYSGVHGGAPVPYLEYFLAGRESGRVVFDALQSEHGSWFLRKRNRNMIVEVTGPVPTRPDFRWLRLDQIGALFRCPNLINMDARTVLSGMPFFAERFRERGRRPAGPPLHPLEKVLSWFTEMKCTYHLESRVRALGSIDRWRLVDGRIVHDEGRYFSVIGVAVSATNREVERWSQPMFEPAEVGLIGFIGRHIEGVFHVLVHAKTEAGTRDVVELAPTVSCIPSNYTGLPPERRPRYLDELLAATPENTLVDVVHSEEGGRFMGAESRYVAVDLGAEFGLDVPADFCWMTIGQLADFVRHGNCVNVAARCLLSCLAADPDIVG